MLARTLAVACFAAIGWTLAIGAFVRYGGPMAKFFNLKSAGVALVCALPVVLNKLVPAVPVEVWAAVSSYIGVRLLHLDPSELGLKK